MAEGMVEVMDIGMCVLMTEGISVSKIKGGLLPSEMAHTLWLVFLPRPTLLLRQIAFCLRNVSLSKSTHHFVSH